mgnify:CR=1 FL=1
MNRRNRIMAKIAINGFGRIGRNAFKIAVEKGMDIVAINDLTDAPTLAHLLKYDTCFGKFNGTVEVKDNNLVVNGKEIKVLAERNPADLPWKELGVDIVVESTGIFRKKEQAQLHIDAGAKKVIISAPGKGTKSIVMGVNEGDYNPAEDDIVDNASCTTNCLAPVAKVIEEKFGVVKGIMTTVHSYTNDQRILDLPHSDLRRARAAAESIIPTTTGAAEAVAKVIPSLKGKLTGMAMRVPTPTVSVVDLTVELKKEVTVEEINAALKEAADEKVLGYSDEPLVSVDYKMDSRSSIVDGLSTLVMGGNMVKIVSWYDNEWGCSNRIVDLTQYIAERL